MDARKNVLLLILVLGVTDDASSQAEICMSTCLSDFQSMLQGVSNQDTACAYVPTYINCLRLSCSLSDFNPYLPPVQEVLSSSGFTCDLSSLMYSNDQIPVSSICISTCETAFQSNIITATSQTMACAIADNYMNCLETSCNVDSSQYVSHVNLGLSQQGFTTCDGSSDVTNEPEAESPSSSSAISCSVLQVLAVLAIATFTSKYVSLWQL